LESQVLRPSSERWNAGEELEEDTADRPHIRSVNEETRLSRASSKEEEGSANENTHDSVVGSFKRTSGLTYSAVPTKEGFDAAGAGSGESPGRWKESEEEGRSGGGRRGEREERVESSSPVGFEASPRKTFPSMTGKTLALPKSVSLMW